MQTVTSQAFNQNPTAAKRKATKEPVKITERGKVSHVLLSIAEYEAITGQSKNIVDMLEMTEESADYEFDKLNASSIKPTNFD
jgi:PHD/YefM family antitoxin component YafN of YafNO toxin-antitoxin module